MRVDDFHFDLPANLIAQEPLYPREAAKLLHVAPHGGLADKTFGTLAELLRPGDLLVFNRSRVIPARLFGVRRRGNAKAHVEATLTEQLDSDTWTSFCKPGKRLEVGDTVGFGEGFEAVVVVKDGPEITLRFNRSGAALVAALERVGSMPLPPYIKRARGGDTADLADYQPFTAKDPGSVAAATASLHFDADAVDRLRTEVGIETAEVTLHVGLGTFAPIRVDDTRDHIMHFERCAIDASNARAIANAKTQGRRILAVGTTVLRTLESLSHNIISGEAAARRTDLFITPGYQFSVVDALITNFHLPKSTLFMLVCAFSGHQEMLAAYQHAIEQRYRFFSYGDGCFLERKVA